MPVDIVCHFNLFPLYFLSLCSCNDGLNSTVAVTQLLSVTFMAVQSSCIRDEEPCSHKSPLNLHCGTNMKYNVLSSVITANIEFSILKIKAVI